MLMESIATVTVACEKLSNKNLHDYQYLGSLFSALAHRTANFLSPTQIDKKWPSENLENCKQANNHHGFAGGFGAEWPSPQVSILVEAHGDDRIKDLPSVNRKQKETLPMTTWRVSCETSRPNQEAEESCLGGPGGGWS